MNRPSTATPIKPLRPDSIATKPETVPAVAMTVPGQMELRFLHPMKALRLHTFVLVGFMATHASAQNVDFVSYKPRVINTTDLGADPDDEQSMVRQLVCANEFDIEGLIVSTGCWKKTQSNTKMLDKIVDAYAECYDNLKVHADGFPTPE